MQIQFDKDQEYQLEAIQSVISLFEGQPLAGQDFDLNPYFFNLTPTASDSQPIIKVGNDLIINQQQLLTNLKSVQQVNELPVSDEFVSMTVEKERFKPQRMGASHFGEREKEKIKVPCTFPNYSIEMETGTGKTYVYLRTIYELNKTYGFSKFVIVVPSVAIREGVLQNLEITDKHFQELYQKPPINFDVYDSKKVNNLANFARSNAIQILVINIDSFTKDTNIINQVRERGIAPIKFIQATNPIVIVDEPQNMETAIRKEAISNLNPLCCLRYSATHTNAYNLIYSLNPVQAYDKGLVKQIEVESIVDELATSGAFVKINSFKQAKKSISVMLTINKLVNNEVIKAEVIAKSGDNLYDLSNKLDVYKEGYQIISLDTQEKFIEFANGETVEQGTAHDEGVHNEVQRTMIRKTIENHLYKELKLADKGIKVLSLFFIDKVSNYREYDEQSNPAKGKFALWFEEELQALLTMPRFAPVKTHYDNYSIEQLHNGYFAQDKKGKLKESNEKRTNKDDESAFHLIMKDKQKLLSNNEPLRFIFSHSALREGWDNPNVFQICTLNETASELKKRQEIGRGLRLCVDQNGQRNLDRQVNVLTVIANENYEAFAKALQTEIENDCGVEFKNRIKNAREKTIVKLNNKALDNSYFLELWEKIKYQTEYSVHFSTDELIEKASQAIKTMPSILAPHIVTTKVAIKMGNTGITTASLNESKKEVKDIKYNITDFISFIQSRTELTRDTIIKILKTSERINDVLINPQLFMEQCVLAINNVFDELKINNIHYEKIAGRYYQKNIFDIGEAERYLSNLLAVQNTDKTLYNFIEYDSEVEREFASDCESREDVLFYAKLPSRFKIKTPIGFYNPDWALIKREHDDAKKIYFIAETKGAKAVKNNNELRPRELNKIKCGKKHFSQLADVNFKVVANVSDL